MRELDAGTINTPHDEYCCLDTDKGRCIRIRVHDTKLYLKSEVNRYIENIVNKTMSMFRDSSECRGLDITSPLGKIANVAFRHWCIIEQRESYYKTVKDISESRLERIHQLNSQIEFDNKNNVIKIRRHKYKRCLQYAKHHKTSSLYFDLVSDFWSSRNKYMEQKYRNKVNRHDKYTKRWLEIAETFKEAK